jgi:hypothetical protein
LFVQGQDLLAEFAVGGEVVDEGFAAFGSAVFGEVVVGLSVEGEALAAGGQRDDCYGAGGGDDDAAEGADHGDPGWVHDRSPSLGSPA